MKLRSVPVVGCVWTDIFPPPRCNLIALLVSKMSMQTSTTPSVWLVVLTKKHPTQVKSVMTANLARFHNLERVAQNVHLAKNQARVPVSIAKLESLRKKLETSTAKIAVLDCTPPLVHLNVRCAVMRIFPKALWKIVKNALPAIWHVQIGIRAIHVQKTPSTTPRRINANGAPKENGLQLARTSAKIVLRAIIVQVVVTVLFYALQVLFVLRLGDVV